MTPEISEFSYGFALTNELVGWTELHAAPVFPSLIEEGKMGGGYDVKLELPAAPLYLQFKRSDYMSRGTAREVQKGAELEVPFHRFTITERKRSFQHTSLLSLDNGQNLVFYAAPRFHTLEGINVAWAAQRVAQRSIFVAPMEIGLIDDDEAHTVAFDPENTFFCSKPRKIEATSIGDLRARLLGRLAEDQRPLREQLPEWIDSAREASERARETQIELKRIIDLRQRPSTAAAIKVASEDPVGFRRVPIGIRQRSLPPPAIEVRSERPLSPERSQLKELGEEARRAFNAQFIVVQPKS